ncbi:MAG TPA: GNAT family N-acetyltransferase, partial [Streptosporangiaceae bacterium]|nr:GNAT family N-acetyltransferase [Streptosporangiaceae bacterium]
RAANEVSWDDLQKILSSTAPANCQCQRYKMLPKECLVSTSVEERAHRLRSQTDPATPDAEATTGLVAYLDGEPVGWCAVEPRIAYIGLVRGGRVAWTGRSEDRTDDSVWAVTCFVTRAGFRRRGISRALVRAAVEFARGHGARRRGLSHDDKERRLGRAARRHRGHIRRRWLHRGLPGAAAARRHAHRLLNRGGRPGK